MPNLRIGSRGSQLALWRANRISVPLRARGHKWVKTSLTRAWFLTDASPNGSLKVVLKRGTASSFQGGLIGRLSLLRDVLLRIVQHA